MLIFVELTGFGDEISPDLEVQLNTMKRLGVMGLDLRSAFGKNVSLLSDEEVDKVGERVVERGMYVQTISSPVNKVKYSPDARLDELKKLERCAEIANRLRVGRIRVFSPETPCSSAGAPPANDLLWPEVRSWMADQVALAADKGVVLLHENDGRFFGAYPGNAKLLLQEFAGPNFRAIFDFGNSVLIGLRTMRDWFPWLLPYLDTLHIKDATAPPPSSGAQAGFVAAGEGDGEMVEAFGFLKKNGWDGALTLEPHAQVAGPQGGFSGAEAFEHAVNALRAVLKEAGVASGGPEQRPAVVK
jgi:sugar phosphate isomerase/epimerase